MRGGKGSGVLAILFGSLAGAAAANSNTNQSADAIPPLRPPYQELPPSFWEQNGLTVIAAGVILVVLIAALVWLLMRPKPITPIPPHRRALEALERLRAAPLDSALLVSVSPILRQYLVEAFALPLVELTTTEFCETLMKTPSLGEQLQTEVCRLLKHWDTLKFSPSAQWGSEQPVADAVRLVNESEKQLSKVAAEAALAGGGQPKDQSPKFA